MCWVLVSARKKKEAGKGNREELGLGMAACYFRKGFADEVTFESQMNRGGEPHSDPGRQRA